MKMQMTKMLGTALYTAAVAAMLGLPASAGQAPMAALQLQATARAAKTAPERTVVAKQDRLEAGVAAAEAVKLDRSFGAMAYKWPAMANSRQPWNVTSAEARRSVAENR